MLRSLWVLTEILICSSWTTNWTKTLWIKPAVHIKNLKTFCRKGKRNILLSSRNLVSCFTEFYEQEENLALTVLSLTAERRCFSLLEFFDCRLLHFNLFESWSNPFVLDFYFFFVFLSFCSSHFLYFDLSLSLSLFFCNWFLSCFIFPEINLLIYSLFSFSSFLSFSTSISFASFTFSFSFLISLFFSLCLYLSLFFFLFSFFSFSHSLSFSLFFLSFFLSSYLFIFLFSLHLSYFFLSVFSLFFLSPSLLSFFHSFSNLFLSFFLFSLSLSLPPPNCFLNCEQSFFYHFLY